VPSESGTVYGIEIWGLDGGWKGTDKTHSRFCKIIIGVPRFSANNWSYAGIARGEKL
jgi:hypothetical protein